MTYSRFMLLASLLLVAPVGVRAQQASGTSSSTEEVTIVTAERLVYDAKGQFAVFEKNVVVTDPQVQLVADTLTLRFDAEGQAESIEAEGNVRITQADKKAIAGAAKYNIQTGEFVLTDDPRVMRGQDVLQAERITFWRDQNKLICEPKARLIIYPQGDGDGELFGDFKSGTKSLSR